MLAALALLALGASGAGVGAPSKGYSCLANSVDAATFICVGTVTDVVDVPSPRPVPGVMRKREVLPVARVAIERTLKGDRSLTVVHHEAWGTWSCDGTSARVGEKAVFLFRPSTSAGDVREAIRERVGPEPLMRNVGSGDGILRIGMSLRGPVVSGSGAPDALRAEGTRHESSFAALVRYVEELVAFAPETVVVHARSGFAYYASAEHNFDLRILDDGRVRLAQALGSAERVSTLRLEPSAWATLRGELATRVRDERRAIGSPAGAFPARRLSLRLGEGTLRYHEPSEGGPPRPDDEDQRLAVREILEAWALVRAAVPCEGCADHSDADRAWLEAR